MMSAIEALEWAADYCDRQKIFEPPRNDRGYIADGHKMPTVAEKVAIIKEIAEQVTDATPPRAFVVLSEAFMAKLDQDLELIVHHFEARELGDAHAELKKLTEDVKRLRRSI